MTLLAHLAFKLQFGEVRLRAALADPEHIAIPEVHHAGRIAVPLVDREPVHRQTGGPLIWSHLLTRASSIVCLWMLRIVSPCMPVIFCTMLAGICHRISPFTQASALWGILVSG